MATVTLYPLSDYALVPASKIINNVGNSNNLWSYVDEASYSDSDYIYSIDGTAPYIHWTRTATSITGTVSSVVSYARYKVLASYTGVQARSRIVVGGTTYYGSWHNLSSQTSYAQFTHTWNNNPKSGVAWTADDINNSGSNALQYIGVELDGESYFDGKTWTYYNVYCSWFNLVVTYTAGATYEMTVTEAVTAADALSWLASMGVSVSEFATASDAEVLAMFKKIAMASGGPGSKVGGGASAWVNQGSRHSRRKFDA